MDKAAMKFESIDQYIAAAAPRSRPILKQIRRTVRAAAPDAEEAISYGMPTFKQRGVLIHFAAFKAHIGVFPPSRGTRGWRRQSHPMPVRRETSDSRSMRRSPWI